MICDKFSIIFTHQFHEKAENYNLKKINTEMEHVEIAGYTMYV